MKHILLLLLLTFTFLLKAQVTRGIVAKYSFNSGQAINECGSLQPKVSGASFVNDRFGNSEAAIYLHGNISSYLNLGTDDLLKPRCGSVSLWVNIDIIMYKGAGNWDYNPILITKNNSGDDFNEGYFIGLNYSTFKLNTTTTENPENQVTLNSLHEFSLRKWHHIVMTYDDDFLTLFLDNTLEAKLPKNFKSVFLKGGSVMIGNSMNQKNSRFLCGTVDDVILFNRVISPDEVDQLYNAPDPNRFHTYFKWLCKFLAFISLLGITVWFSVRKIRKDLKRQKEKSAIISWLNELETKAIRSQMNPHFMFNSLNTLQRFILEEDIINANSYLVKFSDLLRKLLESSAADSISLKEEIEILSSYIEIEKLRFDKFFEYTILSTLPNSEQVQIPFMLIQPFVENAIWHGLLAKQDMRTLNITFSDIDDKTLLCRVEDNGVGRKYSFTQRDPFKKRSMAINFISQRLEILGKAEGTKASLNIIDKEDEHGKSLGTLVEIIIPKIK